MQKIYIYFTHIQKIYKVKKYPHKNRLTEDCPNQATT